jgi:nickel ABC transporter nickel/metallophore binding protein
MSTLKLRIALIGLMAIAILAACATPTPQIIRETSVQTQVVTQIVEVAGTPVVQEVVVTATPEPAPEVEQVFIIGASADSGPLNPHDYRSQWVALDMVYEPLVRYAADGTIVPWLAESWDVSEDGLTWTFHLREDVSFHDGTPFDAEAVKWNLERWIGTERHSWLPTTNVVDTIETPDDHTVVLGFESFYYPALQDLTLIRPVRFLSPKAADADGNFVEPVGTGPWMVAERTEDQQTVFVPNENYWGAKPTLDQVIWKVIPDAQTRIAALLSGEVHLIGGEYIGGISVESIPVLQRNPDVKLVTAEGSTAFLVQFNHTRPPFDDPLLRRALNYAVDRQAISDRLFQGLAKPAQGLFPPNVPYVTYPHPEYYTYDQDQARALLAEAGWTPGADGILEKDGQPFKAVLVVDTLQFPQWGSIAQVLQASFKEIGVDVEIRQVDTGALYDAFETDAYDLAMTYTYGAPYDPHSLLSASLHTRTLGAESGDLWYTSPELDQMLDESVTIQDEGERQAYYDRIWTYLDENATVLPIVYSYRVYAVSSRVEGFQMAGTEYEVILNGLTITAN